MSELIPINIVIGDRTYRIKTLAKDEEVIRRTLKTVNDKIIEFKTDSNPVLEKEVTDALLKMELAIDKAL